MRRTNARTAYTLLEVILALGLALILVAAIQTAVQMTYTQWEIGRQAADEAQVVRALFLRLRGDLQATLTTWQPPKALPQSSGTSSPATTPGATPAAGATPTAGASSTSTPATSTTPSSSSDSSANADNPTTFPSGGVNGGSDNISLVVRLAPGDLDFSPNADPMANATVMRTVTYRIGTVSDSSSVDNGVDGLIRAESPRMPDSTTPDGQSSDGRSDLLAPEVKQIKFSYYDGLFWNDMWDLTQSGPPVSVQIEVGIQTKTLKNLGSDGLRWYRAIVTLPPVPSSDSSSSGGSSGASSGSSGTSSTGSSSSSGGATMGAGS